MLFDCKYNKIFIYLDFFFKSNFTVIIDTINALEYRRTKIDGATFQRLEYILTEHNNE